MEYQVKRLDSSLRYPALRIRDETRERMWGSGTVEMLTKEIHGGRRVGVTGDAIVKKRRHIDMAAASRRDEAFKVFD